MLSCYLTNLRFRCFTVVTAVICILLSSCTDTYQYRTEINEVYSVKNTNGNYDAGRLLYRDSILYQNSQIPLEKYIFDKSNVLSGIEKYPKINRSNELKSSYTAADGTALSYYKYSLNDAQKKERVEAYDASNDELLRYEEIEYNEQGQLSVRKIFTSEGQLATSYSMLYDIYGNELRKITQHLIRDTIIIEESKITRYNEAKEWSEKWGFINDQPIAFYKRQIIQE